MAKLLNRSAAILLVVMVLPQPVRAATRPIEVATKLSAQPAFALPAANELPAPKPAAGALPNTGSDLPLEAALGALLVGAGAALSAHRRRAYR